MDPLRPGSPGISQSVRTGGPKRGNTRKAAHDATPVESFSKASLQSLSTADLFKSARILTTKQDTTPLRMLEKAWSYNKNCTTDHQAAIGADGTVYGINCYGALFALDGASGAEKWSNQAGERFSDPVIGDTMMYAGTVSKKVCAFDMKTGEKKWGYSTAKDEKSSQTPDTPIVGQDGTVFVASDSGKIVALDGKTGEKKWIYRVEKHAGAFSEPVQGKDGTLYVGCYDGTLVALDGTKAGKKWEYRLDYPLEIAAPAVDADGTVYAMCSRRDDMGKKGATKLVAVGQTKSTGMLGKEKITPRVLWEKEFPGPSKSGPAVGDFSGRKVVYAPTGDGMLRAFDAAQGNELWKIKSETKNTRLTTFGSDRRTPVADEKNSRLYVSSKDGILLSLDPLKGTKLWEEPFTFRFTMNPLEYDENPLSRPVLDSQGNVYVTELEGSLRAYKPPQSGLVEQIAPQLLQEEQAGAGVLETEGTISIDGVRLKKKN